MRSATCYRPPLQPGLVLVLGKSGRGSVGATIRARLDSRLGRDPSVAVVGLQDLTQSDHAGELPGALERVRIERTLADRVRVALEKAHAHADGRRLVVAVMAVLSDPEARRQAVWVLPMIESALRRVALPRSMDPALVGIHILPRHWTPLQGAGLYAWLKEFTRLISAPDSIPRRGYTLPLVVGHSDHDAAGGGSRIAFPEHELCISSADFAAACFQLQIVDEVMAWQRGQNRRDPFSAFGIAPFRDFADAEQGALGSRILWPVDASIRPARDKEVLKLSTANISQEWRQVGGSASAQATDQWAIQIACGLHPEDIIGAEMWRTHYLGLAEEERRALHGIADAADWDDPLDSSIPEPVPAPVESVLFRL